MTAPLVVDAIRSCSCAHFGGQRRLITHGRRHAAQQCGDLAAGLREAEDVVDEQQRVGAGLVAEILGHRQGRQRHAQPSAGRLVHLAEHHAGLIDDAAAGVADLGFLHFEPQARALAGSLADAGEHAEAAVGRRDAGDQLGENDRLAESGAAEQPGLAAAHERRQQVDDLDARLEQLGLRRKVAKRRRLAMNRPVFLGIHRAAAIDRVAGDVEHAAERRLADGHLHRAARIDAVLAAHQAVGAAQGDAPHAAAAQVLLHFAGEVDLHALVLGRRPSRRCKSPAG